MRPEQRNSLIEYGILTFGIAWGLVVAYLLVYVLTGSWLGVFSYWHPIHWLAGYSALVGAVLVVFRRDDADDLIGWLKTSFSFHNIGLGVLTLITIPVLSIVLSMVLGVPLNPGPVGQALFTAAVVFFAFAVPAEELGWRGVILPVVSEYTTVSVASLLTGLLALVWRIPMYVLLFTANGVYLDPFSAVAVGLLTLGISLLNCWLYHRERHSLIYGMLLNWSALIAIYALGIETILVAGVTMVLSVVLVMLLGMNLKNKRTSQGEKPSFPMSVNISQEPAVIRSSSFVALGIALVGVGLLIITMWVGSTLAQYVMGIPLPAQLTSLVEYTGKLITFVANVVGVLLLAVTLVIAGITLVIGRVMSRTLFLQKRVKSLESKVLRLEGLLSPHQHQDTQ